MIFIYLIKRRLNSTGDDTEDETEGIDECPSGNGNNIQRSPLPINYNLDQHFSFLAAREHLQPFCGQVPQKKKKKVVERTESDSPVAAKTKAKVIQLN